MKDKFYKFLARHEIGTLYVYQVDRTVGFALKRLDISHVCSGYAYVITFYLWKKRLLIYFNTYR